MQEEVVSTLPTRMPIPPIPTSSSLTAIRDFRKFTDESEWVKSDGTVSDAQSRQSLGHQRKTHYKENPLENQRTPESRLENNQKPLHRQSHKDLPSHSYFALNPSNVDEHLDRLINGHEKTEKRAKKHQSREETRNLQEVSRKSRDVSPRRSNATQKNGNRQSSLVENENHKVKMQKKFRKLIFLREQPDV